MSNGMCFPSTYHLSYKSLVRYLNKEKWVWAKWTHATYDRSSFVLNRHGTKHWSDMFQPQSRSRSWEADLFMFFSFLSFFLSSFCDHMTRHYQHSICALIRTTIILFPSLLENIVCQYQNADLTLITFTSIEQNYKAVQPLSLIVSKAA